MRSARVVQAAEVRAEQHPAGASVRTLMDTGLDGPDGRRPGLVRRSVEVAPGARFAGTAGGGGELLFVIEGSGRLDAGSPKDISVRVMATAACSFGQITRLSNYYDSIQAGLNT